jgi:hypothetical protein
MQDMLMRIFLILFILATVLPSSLLAATSLTETSLTETGRDGKFIAYADGTVLDTRTNLMWAAKDSGHDINWGDAKSYCANHRGGGYKDWRLPTWDELAGLYNSNKSYRLTQRGYSVHLTELIQLSDCCPWASETRGSEAAILDFGNGPRIWSPQSHVGPALPVRSVK